MERVIPIPNVETAEDALLLRRLRILLACFIVGLILSGLTAFWTRGTAEWLANWMALPADPPVNTYTGLAGWIVRVREGLRYNDLHYPFMAYGTDWLAFGHIVIAINFFGAWRDPVRNIWVFDFGLIACALVIPLALVCGHSRGIPFGWQCVDSLFGIVGCVPLLVCRGWARRLETSLGAPAPSFLTV